MRPAAYLLSIVSLCLPQPSPKREKRRRRHCQIEEDVAHIIGLSFFALAEPSPTFFPTSPWGKHHAGRMSLRGAPPIAKIFGEASGESEKTSDWLERSLVEGSLRSIVGSAFQGDGIVVLRFLVLMKDI